MEFWLITSLLALIASALLALALLRGHKTARPAAEFDLQVYRDQLAEVERDAARGVISPDDAERLQTEISRRILAADTAIQQKQVNLRSPKALQFGLIAGLALVLVAGSFFMYRELGAPGYGDLSLKTRIEIAEKARAERPDQATAEASLPAPSIAPNAPLEYVELVEKLREAVAQRPDDLQGASLLATHEMRLGNAYAAHKAQATVLRLKGPQASSEDYANYADMLVMSAGGYVSPQAEDALAKSLKKDPKNGVARYYSGLMMIQVGRPDVAFRAWATLLQDSPDDASWVTPIRAQIEDLAFRAGVKYELPALKAPTLAGPTQDDIDNASEMSAQERQEMIQGMVAQLSDRLATEGGSAREWARLIATLGVLGDADQAALIWQNAKDVFAGRDEDLSIVRDAGAHFRDRTMIIENVEEFSAVLPSMRAVIGLDLGTKTIGVAVSDGLRSVASPLETVKRTKYTADAAHLTAIIANRDIAGIVLGLPYNMDGSEGPRCQSTRAFARNFARESDLPITYWDERLSTVAAERALLEADTSRKRRAEVIDNIAAAYILQGLLDRLQHLQRA